MIEWAKVVASVLIAYSWPLALAFAVFILKKPLLGLLRPFDSLEVGNVKITFDKGLAKVEADTATLPPPEAPQIPPAAQGTEAIDLSPYHIVSDAWRKVENAIHSLYAVSGRRRRRAVPAAVLVRSLWARNIIDDTLNEAIRDLRRLRELAAEYDPRQTIDEEQAVRYVESAERVLSELQQRITEQGHRRADRIREPEDAGES